MCLKDLKRHPRSWTEKQTKQSYQINLTSAGYTETQWLHNNQDLYTSLCVQELGPHTGENEDCKKL